MLIINQRPSAELATIVQESSNPGPFSLISIISIHNPFTVSIASDSVNFFSYTSVGSIPNGEILSTSTTWGTCAGRSNFFLFLICIHYDRLGIIIFWHLLANS